MWNEVFALQVPLNEKVVRTVVVYLLVVVLVRLFGRRGLASMNTLDFVVLFLLATTVESALLGEDTSILAGVVSAFTLVVVNLAFNRFIDAAPLAQRIVEGKPTTVIENGKPVQGALRRLAMRTSELDHAIRSQHGDDLEEIEHGELTPSGQFVLTLKPGEQSSTKGDIAALNRRLEKIESLLSAR